MGFWTDVKGRVCRPLPNANTYSSGQRMPKSLTYPLVLLIVSAIHCYVINYPKTWQVKTANLTVSRGQEPRSGNMIGSSSGSLTRVQPCEAAWHSRKSFQGDTPTWLLAGVSAPHHWAPWGCSHKWDHATGAAQGCRSQGQPGS